MDQNRPGIGTWLGYAGVVAGGIVVWMLINARGNAIVAPVVAHASLRGSTHSEILAHVLFALATITLVARVLGLVFRRFLGQPPVIGEIVAGLMLGPSLLGAISPSGYAFLLPQDAAPYLGILSKVGVVLFMFLVGLEFDPKLLAGDGHKSFSIALSSKVVPFVLGAALALGLYPVYSNREVPFTVFSLFLGVSMSVTAFPVLARILTDRNVQRTRLGVTALACAAIDDLTAWSLLALVIAIATAKVAGLVGTAIGLGVFLLVIGFVIRPFVQWLAAREEKLAGPLSVDTLAIISVLLLTAATATEMLGLHALFGAFAVGVFVPHDGRLGTAIREKLEDAVTVLFLPAFFAFTGMKTQLGLVTSASDLPWLLAIISLATIGKFGGTFLAARLNGYGLRPSAALGLLMNTRGLMELIVLNVGLEMGVLSPTLFTMLVLMALVTTFSTAPLLRLVMGSRGFAEDPVAEPSARVA
jgi:Kef-type K+ transport system membrane component KefB